MADEKKDRYAAARADLRDTAKWYSAALAALGVGLAGGLSFGILPELGEDHLEAGILVGSVVVLVILAAIAAVQEILFPKAFDRDRLKEPAIRASLAPYVDELLPADISGLDELWQKFEAATDQGDIIRLRGILAKITSFAAFLDLQAQVRRTNRLILFFFIIACAGVGFLAYLQGLEKRADAADTIPLTFSPGENWADLTAALADACPAPGPIAAQGRPDTPFDGWWTITLKGPEPCAGATFAVPGVVVKPGK